MARGYERPVRPPAERALRLDPARAALLLRPLRLPPAAARWSTSTCWCCSRSGSASSSSTAATSASRSRSSTRRSSTCCAGCCGSASRASATACSPSAPLTWLAIATMFLIGFRVALNIADSGVIDVGYAGVIGADRITHGEPIYGEHAFPDDNPLRRHLRPRQLLRLRPVRAGAALERRVGRAAGGARRGDLLRPGDGGRAVRPREAAAAARRRRRPRRGAARRARPRATALGVILAFAWCAYPYTTYALQSNSNDSLVAALLDLGVRVRSPRRWARGVLLGAGEHGRSSRRWRWRRCSRWGSGGWSIALRRGRRGASGSAPDRLCSPSPSSASPR